MAAVISTAANTMNLGPYREPQIKSEPWNRIGGPWIEIVVNNLTKVDKQLLNTRKTKLKHKHLNYIKKSILNKIILKHDVQHKNINREFVLHFHKIFPVT